MGDVVSLNIITTQKSRPDGVIEGAAEYGLTDVVILGFDKNGEFYFASSYADTGSVIYFLEKAKHELFKTEDRIAESGVDPRGQRT